MLPYQLLHPGELKNVKFLSSYEEEEAVKVKSSQPEDWIWHTRNIEYARNSNGFRCPEFNDIDWEKSNAVVGCSAVFGHSIDDENMLTSFLENMSGETFINLGICGAGPDAVFQHALWAHTMGAKHVYVLMPYYARFTLFYKDKDLGINCNKQIKFIDHNHKLGRTNEYLDALKYLADGFDLKHRYDIYCQLLSGMNNITVFDFVNTSSRIFNGEASDLIDKEELRKLAKQGGAAFLNHYKGRDLVHPGINENKTYAEYILRSVDI